MINLKTLFRDLFSLTKPRLSFLVIVTGACGYVLAALILKIEFSLLHFSLTQLGLFLVVGASNALNCFLERDVDQYMSRTKKRPLVTGQLSPSTALGFGIGIGILGTVLIYKYINPLTALLGLLGILSYVFVYTPMKRYSWWALVAGAVPGAVPPLMGATALTNRIESVGVLTFLILFFWQLPHFAAIAFYRKTEYEAASLKTLASSFPEQKTFEFMLLSSIGLLIVSLLPYFLGLASFYYLILAVILGGVFCYFSWKTYRGLWLPVPGSRRVFFASLFYLPLVLGAWVLERSLFT